MSKSLRFAGLIPSKSKRDGGESRTQGCHMWNWRQKGTLPPEPNLITRPPEHVLIPGSSARRRLFMVASALITRGMNPDQAYKTALYYAEGPGRGQPWINALTEADRVENSDPKVSEHRAAQ